MYLRPTDLRDANIRRVFRALLARPRCSRAELARHTGLSGVTAGRVVDAMRESGLVEEVESPVSLTPVMGRPPQMVALSSRPRFIAIEIGVRETRIAALPLACPPEDMQVIRIPTPESIAGFATAVRRPELPLSVADCDAVLVTIPGVVDRRAGSVLVSPNLHWIEGDRLLRSLSALGPAPVLAIQEVQALAIGHQAAGEPAENFMLLDFADGVGGAVVMRGRVLTGEVSLSGELGHTPVMNNTRRCGCGGVGCLETLAASQGLLKSFREAHKMRRADWSMLTSRVSSAGIEPWLQTTIDAVGGVVAGAINLLGIGRIIVTGDFPSLHSDVTTRLGASIEAHSLLGRFARVSCSTAKRRRWLGLIVAASERVLGRDNAIPRYTPSQPWFEVGPS